MSGDPRFPTHYPVAPAAVELYCDLEAEATKEQLRKPPGKRQTPTLNPSEVLWALCRANSLFRDTVVLDNLWHFFQYDVSNKICQGLGRF